VGIFEEYLVYAFLRLKKSKKRKEFNKTELTSGNLISILPSEELEKGKSENLSYKLLKEENSVVRNDRILNVLYNNNFFKNDVLSPYCSSSKPESLNSPLPVNLNSLPPLLVFI
jgi:hypothetical protein